MVYRTEEWLGGESESNPKLILFGRLSSPPFFNFGNGSLIYVYAAFI